MNNLLKAIVCVCVLACVLLVACEIESVSSKAMRENNNWNLIGESALIKAMPIYDKNGYWEHWHLEFENGIVLNTKDWEGKPFWIGKTYTIYYNSSTRKTFLEMK